MKSEQFYIEGQAAIAEYLRFRPEAILELWAKKTQMRGLEELAARAGIGVRVQELKDSERRRGEGEEVAAPVRAVVRIPSKDARDMISRLELKERENDVILALDHLTDPRNVGAIARSAAFFGVREILLPERRQAPITQATVATAQGAFAIADVYRVGNLQRALEELKSKADYWIVGTAMDGEPVSRVAGFYSKIVLVMGNEETGLSPLIRKTCDRVVALPGRVPSGYDSGLESLNVSVASGIALYALLSPAAVP